MKDLWHWDILKIFLNETYNFTTNSTFRIPLYSLKYFGSTTQSMRIYGTPLQVRAYHDANISLKSIYTKE